MKTALIQQYAKVYRVQVLLVNEFSKDAWLNTGRKGYSPVRLALHELQSIKYYLQDETPDKLASGKDLNDDCWKMAAADLPTQEELVSWVKVFAARTEKWLKEMDLDKKNTSFPWAGDTDGAIALFMFQHYLFHLGELSGLLNESKDGEVEDLYVKA
jgi:hypothetical protein